MRCPRDGTLLDEKPLGDVLIDECSHCHGLFFDGGELEQVQGGSLFPYLSKRPAESDTPRCPRCDTLMQPYRYTGKLRGQPLASEPLVIDHCPSCRGYWLDQGELGDVRDLVQERKCTIVSLDDVTAKQYILMVLLELPLEYNEPTHRRPWMTIAFVVLNAILFFASYIAYLYRLEPEEVRNWAGLVPFVLGPRTLYMLFTYQFAHASITHMLGNLYLLYIFGDNLEDRWGRWRYLLMYLATGVIAGLAHAIHTSEPGIPLIGASGAIAGLLGAYLITFPRARVGFVFFFVPLRLSAFVYLLFYFLVQGAGMLLEWLAGFSFPISVSCHTGGFIVGMIFGLIWRKQDVRRQQQAG